MASVVLPTLEWGPEGDRRVLLVHGLSSAAHIWWRVGSELAARECQVTAPDLRGHGNAPRATSYRLEELAGDLLRLGGGWDAVVGHSLGGSVALLAALEPGFCRRLVLLDPLIEIEETHLPSLISDQLSELEPRSPEELAGAHPRWDPEDIFWKHRATQQVTPRTVKRVFSDNQPWNLSARVSGLAVNTLLVAASPRLGGLLSPELAASLAESNPAVSWQLAADCGHSIQRENPDLVVRLTVTEF